MRGAHAEPSPIRFGTDGWRAQIAHEFTFENVARVAQAYADFLKQQSADEGPGGGRRTPSVVVGYDRRFMSEHFALRAAEVLTGNGVAVRMFDADVPTPLVSWAVRERGADGGVVITASHNPATFNGFKIKAPWGGSATPETTRSVEALVDARAPRLSPLAAGAVGGLGPQFESYRRQVESYIDLGRLRAADAAVVIDSMHGTGGRWAESFLGGGRLRAETLRAGRDTLFGGCDPEPIDRNLGPLKARVREAGALVGLATDGDADRVGAVNEIGETMTMHEVVPLILLHLARRRRMEGGVVRTFSQSVLLKRIAAAHGLALYETPIGFKYVADLMLREPVLIGAEESGGIGVAGHLPERDGLLNTLLFLETVVASGRTPTELVGEMHREFGEFHFGRRDLRVEVARGLALVETLSARPPARVEGHAVRSVETLDGVKLLFADESWLLFRQSGTEPLLRIYAEATSPAKRETLLEHGQRLAHSV
ncbi:MAG TPA: phosphoglucomutase/phosphomannomutase family protein [Pyrinomonadaceae bacterium]|nr:phosphoglucomutase/phosphomannomutase family protein [Pyrinomonadaceae bacterium]